MESNGIWTNIIIIVIVLHLLGGFGFMMYKLSPKKGEVLGGDDHSEEETSKDSEKTNQ